MGWIYDRPPADYKEVIICTTEGKVKAAIYLGNGTWNTFLQVACWQPLPEAPESLKASNVDAPKKRGRPKKNG